MSFSEAARIAAIMVQDPSTQICAEVNGWERPFDWSEWAILDVLDHYRAVNSENDPAPVHRPTMKKVHAYSVSELDEILDAARRGGVSQEIDVVER